MVSHAGMIVSMTWTKEMVYNGLHYEAKADIKKDLCVTSMRQNLGVWVIKVNGVI